MLSTAFKFIRYDKPKSIGVIVGIIISIFLIGQQLSTLRYLTILMGGLINNSNTDQTDIWIVDNKTNNINILSQIDSRLTLELRSVAGVTASYAIVVANATVAMENGTTTSINLVGSEGPTFIAGPNPQKMMTGSLASLVESNAVSAEYFNAKNLGGSLAINQVFELNNKQAVLKVLTKNAQGFGGEYMYTNLQNARFYGGFPEDKVSAVVVKVAEGANRQSIINSINKTFYGVRAWDVEQLNRATVGEILVSSNMGVSFGSLVVFAVISGFFIIGLTLYSSALDRITDYGTLKAIGASNAYVSRLIFTQALLFALIGYLIAIGMLYGFKTGVAAAGLDILIDWKLLLILAATTLFMAVGGSLFAVVKIRKLEPASIF